MDKLMYWIRKELILHLDFNGYRPHTRIGWIWVLIAFIFGYHWFGLVLCIVLSVVVIFNLLNRY